MLMLRDGKCNVPPSPTISLYADVGELAMSPPTASDPVIDMYDQGKISSFIREAITRRTALVRTTLKIRTM